MTEGVRYLSNNPALDALAGSLIDQRSGSEEALKRAAKNTLVRFAMTEGLAFDEDGFDRIWASVPSDLKRADASDESAARAYLEVIAGSFGFPDARALSKRMSTIIPSVDDAESQPMRALPRARFEGIDEQDLLRLQAVRADVVSRLLSLKNPTESQVIFEIVYAVTERGQPLLAHEPIDPARIESAHRLACALAPSLASELGIDLSETASDLGDPLRFTTGADFFARETEAWTGALAEARVKNAIASPVAAAAVQEGAEAAVPRFPPGDFPDPDPRHYDAMRFIAIGKAHREPSTFHANVEILDSNRPLFRAEPGDPLSPSDLSVAQLGIRMREVFEHRAELTFEEMCEQSARITAEMDAVYLARALGIPASDEAALQRIYDVLLIAARASALALGVAFTVDGTPIAEKKKEYTAALSVAGSVAFQLFPLLLHAASAQGAEPFSEEAYGPLMGEASRYLSQVSLESSAAITALNVNATVYPDGKKLRNLLQRVLPEDHRTYKQAASVPTQETSNRLLGALYRMANTTWKSHQLLRAVWEGKPERIDSSERNSAFNAYDLLKLDLIERTRAYEECRVRLGKIAPALSAEDLKDRGLVSRAERGELSAEDLERMRYPHRGRDVTEVNREVQHRMVGVKLTFLELTEILQLAFARGVWEVHLDAISLEKARAAAERFLG